MWMNGFLTPHWKMKTGQPIGENDVVLLLGGYLVGLTSTVEVPSPHVVTLGTIFDLFGNDIFYA